MKRYLLPLILILLLTFTLIGNCAWLSGYDQRIKLTIDNTKIDGALSNFPVTVFFTSTQGEEIFTEFDADADYMKCAFTSSDGTTQLYAEKELFDDSAQKAIYHVKVTSVASGADTDIYYYYDNDHADNTTYIGAINTTAGGHVWDNNFKAVYHMVDATTSTVVDSTSNNNDGTKKGANEPVEATGKVGEGQDFDGTNDYIQCGTDSSLDVTTTLTISAIVSSDTAQLSMVAGKIHTSVYDDFNYGFRLNADNKATLIVGHTTNRTWACATSTGTLVAQDGFYHIAVTWDSSNANFYSNGALDSSPALSFTAMASTGEFNMGRESFSGEEVGMWFMDGDIDELHFSNSVTRNAAWIKATYNSLWDSLLTYGSEETSGVTANSIMFGTNF